MADLEDGHRDEGERGQLALVDGMLGAQGKLTSSSLGGSGRLHTADGATERGRHVPMRARTDEQDTHGRTDLQVEVVELAPELSRGPLGADPQVADHGGVQEDGDRARGEEAGAVPPAQVDGDRQHAVAGPALEAEGERPQQLAPERGSGSDRAVALGQRPDHAVRGGGKAAEDAPQAGAVVATGIAPLKGRVGVRDGVADHDHRVRDLCAAGAGGAAAG